ncbi:aminoacyl-tRNA hydrolase [Paenibacillus thermotolerans]|uniref:aminoacyl-tRNA hydrolase n=1 Tax=Paenibacillus thermotolerans TaxID=3027807 RepID=UPI002367E48B|nr:MULTISPECIES: aminoacyl-tRNA hydrolase [unclassified Paenibacillus]
MKWIVGLGNPGRDYEDTRHNIGWMAIDEVADRWGITKAQSKCKGLVAEGRVGDTKVALIKPMTYMNLSGECVRAFLDFYKVKLEDLIVVYDDMDTQLGSIRLRYQGSPGGHNGIRSIIAHLGTEKFNRIRMGISRPAPGTEISRYVLSSFRKEEAEALRTTVAKAADALEFCLTEPFEKAMAKFNGA